MSIHASASLYERYEQLRKEYKDYRKKARQIMDQKDSDLKKALVRAQAGGRERRGIHTGVELAAPYRGNDMRTGLGGAAGGSSSAGGGASGMGAGVGEPYGAGSMDGAPPLALPDNPTTQYLKNIIIKYMATEEHVVKEHMEAAIATVLRFSVADMNFVSEARKKQGWSLW